ncbi:MAG: LuxR C-terminal-related transcriptional regulator [Acidimicrobiia bacterium]
MALDDVAVDFGGVAGRHLVVDAEFVVETLRSELASCRLLTLTGSGGCGKTRLAYEAAGSALPGVPDGVWCVELAPIADPVLVAAEFAATLGLREEFGRPLLDTLAEQLVHFEGLIVADNCEHVLEHARQVIEHLLRRCPRLRVLVTSREPLGIDGETTWRVPSLDARLGAELFVQRARSVRTGYEPTTAEVGIIDEIVDCLDGIPLAIELAAARMNMMSPSDIRDGLSDRFRLLTGGSRTSLARQQTLEASVAWSYDLLDEAEQALARALSIMPDFDLVAAQALPGEDRGGSPEVVELLGRLVDKSVVRVDHTATATRYRFLESIRQFLQGRLIDSGRADDVRVRHLHHFVSVAERVEPQIAFRESATILAMLEADHDNLQAALDFADTSGRRELALRLAIAMTLFWELRGHVGLATRWFARLLDQDEPEPTMWRGRACWGAAHIGLYSGDVETMTIRAPEALEQAEVFDDDWARARALNTVGFATAVMDPSQARPGLERSIEIGTRTGDEWAVLNSRKMLTAAAWAAQDEAAAFEGLEALREHADRLGATYFLAWYHGLSGMFLTRRGDLARSRTELETAIALCDQIGEPVTGGMSKAWLWSLDLMEGDYDGAERRSAQLLQRASASGQGLGIADLLANLGQVAIARTDPTAAVDLLGPAYAAQLEHGIPFMVATISMTLASAHRRTGDHDGARALLDDLDTLATALGNSWVGAHVDLERSRIALALDDAVDAEQRAHAALAVFAGAARLPDITSTLEQLALIALTLESQDQALRLLGAAAAIRSEHGILAAPPDTQVLDDARAALRKSLGDEAADVHYHEGQALTVAAAVEYVSRARGSRKRPNSGWQSLTPPEQRVVDLLAEGLTNPQIAEQMFIARGTVKVHVSHIFAKLGVANRAELAAMATRRTASRST